MEKTKTKKTSLVTKTMWLAVVDGICALSQIILIIKSQYPFTIEDYLAPLPIPILINFICLFLLVAAVCLTIIVSIDAEKEDELAKLNRYKAGYNSGYITIILIAVGLYLVKDFSFAFSGDSIDALRLPVAILMFAQCIEHIIFIILEKRNLE